MKIILLNTPLIGTRITRDMAGGFGFDAGKETILPPLDLAILAAKLRQGKNTVLIIDSGVDNLNAEEIIQKIINFGADVVIATVSLPSLVNDTQFLKNLKAVFSGKVIAKTSINFKPILKEILRRSKADLCLFGEVDLNINEIVAGQDFAGSAYLKNNKLIINPIKPIENLDQIPLPARDLLKNRNYSYPLLGNNCTEMQTSRGCPFPCAYYCPYPLVQGRKWRAQSPKRVLDELREVILKYQIDKVLFRDATFTLDRARTVKICEGIIQNKLKFSWWCETRINCLDEELLMLMKKTGCRGINIGVETGDVELMKSKAKPGVDIEQLRKINELAKKLGIKLHFLLLIGLPGDARKSLYKTFKMVRRLKPSSLGATIVTPYPGTPLYEEAQKKKWIESEDWSKYQGNLPTMHTDNLSPSEMVLARKMIQGELFLLEKGFPGNLGLWAENLFFKIWSNL